MSIQLSSLLAFGLAALVLIAPTWAAAEPAVLPRPVRMEVLDGRFELNDRTNIWFSEEASNEAKALASILDSRAGIKVEPGKGAFRRNETIELVLDTTADFEVGGEGYRITTGPGGAAVVAATRAGLFYGVQTLRQLMTKDERGWHLPAVSITDRPRYTWRGLHLDVGRHFAPVEFVKRYIDLMAMYKFNTFHWHLTEDQGWRLEIRRYPRLTEVGAWRPETFGRWKTGDGIPHGGFYTQDEVREVVAYAAERHVRIVPEIEMPGHTLAALAAYPELSCTGGPFEVGMSWGVYDDILCAGKDEVFTFLENVLTEVLELFPGTFIHVGGDEAPKTRWESCPLCQKRIKDNGLRDEHHLQTWFIQRMERWLSDRGRRLVGWDEILEGGLPEGATIMSWRGIEGGIAAARSRHDAVMTPTSHCYFDYYQSKAPGEPIGIGGFTPIEKVYGYNPTPDVLTAEEAVHVLGVQGNLWAEYLLIPEMVEYMAYPRAIALAEVAWTPMDRKNFRNFEERLAAHRPLMAEYGINAWKPRQLKPARPATLKTTLPTYKDHEPVIAFDGDRNSIYYSGRAPEDGDTFDVILKDAAKFQEVEVLTGPGRNRLRHGVLEVSPDGERFVKVAEFVDGVARASLKGAEVKVVRVRATNKHEEWLTIREIILR